MNQNMTLMEVGLVAIVTSSIVVAFVICKLLINKLVIKKKKVKKKTSDTIENIHDHSNFEIDFGAALGKSNFYSKKNVIKHDINLWNNVKLELDSGSMIELDFVLRTKKSILLFEVKKSQGYDEIQNTQVFKNSHYSKAHKQEFINSCADVREKFIKKFDLPSGINVKMCAVFINKLTDTTGMASMAKDGVEIYKPNNKQELVLLINELYDDSIKRDVSSNEKDLILIFDHKLKSEAKGLEVTKILKQIK